MIIGICGKLGSGKDTFADWMIGHRNIVAKLSFAKKLKMIAVTLFGIDPTVKSSYNRSILQQIGSKMREIDENVWIKGVNVEYERKYKPRNVVISDVRHVNEAEWIIKNGKLIILNCPDDVRKKRIEKRDFKGKKIQDGVWRKMHKHESETSVDIIRKRFSNHPNTIVINQEDSEEHKNKKKLFDKLIDFI